MILYIYIYSFIRALFCTAQTIAKETPLIRMFFYIVSTVYSICRIMNDCFDEHWSQYRLDYGSLISNELWLSVSLWCFVMWGDINVGACACACVCWRISGHDKVRAWEINILENVCMKRGGRDRMSELWLLVLRWAKCMGECTPLCRYVLWWSGSAWGLLRYSGIIYCHY